MYVCYSLQLNVPFHLLAFKDCSVDMHAAWSQVNTTVDPDGDNGPTQNPSAFIKPIYDFFTIGDGPKSEFHDVNIYNDAREEYNAAKQVYVLASKEYIDMAETMTEGQEPPQALIDLSHKQEEAKTQLLNCVHKTLDSLGTLKYPNPDLENIDYTGDYTLIGKRITEIVQATSILEVKPISQDIWAQTLAAKV